MPRRPLVLALVTLMLACATVSVSSCGSSKHDTDNEVPFHPERPAAPYSTRPICSLLDDQGNGAMISGQDGGTSNVVDGRGYWTFGDTLLTNGGILSNSFGTTTDFQPDDCISFTYPKAANGAARALLPKTDAEDTVWPAAGQVSVQPGRVHFLYNSVATADNSRGYYHFGGIGLGVLDTNTLETRRIIEPLITNDDLRPGESLSLSAGTDIISTGGFTYVYFSVDWNVRVGRVPDSEIERKESYQYWDGSDWVPEIAQSIDILQTRGGQQAFNVAYSAYVGKWVAVYSTATLTAVATAYADSPQGPFVDETVLLRCPAIAHNDLPASATDYAASFLCYHATQHAELVQQEGQALYITFASLAFYKLQLQQFVLGLPIWQWEDNQGDIAYAPASAPPDSAYAREGVAFYAPLHAGEGLSAIHDWFASSTNQHRYAADAPGAEYADHGIVFYASLTPVSGLEPVTHWERGTASVYSTFDLTKIGYARGEVAFYAATLEKLIWFDAEHGYVYAVHIRGKNDFGCCFPAFNPTQQTPSTSSDFYLIRNPDPAGYEGVVCSPVCGTQGKVIWSGPVVFDANRHLRLSPNGPVKADQ